MSGFGSYGAQGIAIDTTSLYWSLNTSSPSILKLPLCGGSIETLATTTSPGVMAVSPSNAYWATGGSTLSIVTTTK